MTVSVTKCDICGAVKGEANKWLKASIDRDGRGLYVCASRTGEESPSLDICSDACLQKRLGEVLAAIRTEPEQGEWAAAWKLRNRRKIARHATSGQYAPSSLRP